jgi:nucleoside-diphosphate-sugar epimerase
MTSGPKSGVGGAAAARAAAAGPRTVLITGVSRGLGRALALELARRGHSVVGCSRSAEPIRSLEAEIASPSRHFLTVADVVMRSIPLPSRDLVLLCLCCTRAWMMNGIPRC